MVMLATLMNMLENNLPCSKMNAVQIHVFFSSNSHFIEDDYPIYNKVCKSGTVSESSTRD